MRAADRRFATKEHVEIGNFTLDRRLDLVPDSNSHSIGSGYVCERPLHTGLIEMPTPKPGDYISAKAAAVYLGISAKTLANARVTGNSPVYTKAFGRIRYQVRDLADYMAARRRRSTSEAGSSE